MALLQLLRTKYVYWSPLANEFSIGAIGKDREVDWIEHLTYDD